MTEFETQLNTNQKNTSGDHCCSPEYPRVLIAILAKQQEPVLPFYLECLEALDYPKKSISLYIRTNNNTDRTAEILKAWVNRVRHLYKSVEMDDSDVAVRVEEFGVHEWTQSRFKVLGEIRQRSMQKALDRDCLWYFVADTDNFIRPNTLKDLVALNLPIVAPYLKHVDPNALYSNYHYKADPNGYYLECEEYHWVHQQRVRGIIQVDVVHCTYLVKSDIIPYLQYDDGSGRYEYVIFSSSARLQGIPQFLDNRQVYGFLTLDESAIEARRLIGAEIEAALQQHNCAENVQHAI